MRRILLVISLLATFSFAASADEATHKELVEQLFTVMNMKESVDTACQEVISAHLNADPMMKPFEGAINGFFNKYISWKAMKEDYTRLYMESFTEDELRDIISFLSSPAGILFMDKSFTLTNEALKIAEQRINSNLGELEAMITAEGNKMIEEQLQKAQQEAESAEENTEIAPAE